MTNKILYISYDGLLDPVGQSQIIPYLTGLSKNGKRFFIISYEKKRRFSNKKDVLILKRELHNHSMYWYPMRYYKKPYLFGALWSILKGAIKGIQLIRREKIQIVHARSYVAASIAYILKLFTNKKLVFDTRGLWVDERVDGNLWRKNSFLYKLGKFWERRFLLKSDSIIVLTEAVKKEIQSFSCLKNTRIPVKVIPTCTDLEKYKIRSKSKELIQKYGLKNKFNLIYFGSVGTWYLIDEMIDFFKVLKNKDKNSHLILLINSNLKKARRLLYNKQVDERDFTILSVYYKEIPKWLSIAHASIFFIKPSYSKISSCPTKLGDSIASGTPVIINSGIGDSDKIVSEGKCGVIINDFSEESYEKAIRDLKIILKDKDLKKRLMNVAKYFSLEDGIKKYLEVYSDLS